MYSRILVAIDGSQTASLALDAALQLAHASGAELRPLYVIDVPPFAFGVPGYDPSVLRDALAEESRLVCRDASDRMTKHGVRGVPHTSETAGGADVAQSILDAAAEWPADLIAMGTNGRRGMQRLMIGSVAERVLRGATLPVLLVPARAAHKTDEGARAPRCDR